MAKHKFHSHKSSSSNLPGLHKINVYAKCEVSAVRKGYILMVALVFSSLIATSAMILHSFVTTDMQISRNVRLQREAILIAQSALDAFIAKQLHYEDVVRLAAGEKNFLLEKGQFSPREYFEIHALIHEEDTFQIRALSEVRKGERVLAAAGIAATLRSHWKPNEN